MFDTRIEMMVLSQERDEYNERTRSGGRKNLFASRILHENEVAYTVRWRENIRASMFVKDDEATLKIVSVHEEGRRKLLHIKVNKTDTDEKHSVI